MDLYVNHVFNKSVDSVFLEFKQGFYTAFDRDLLKLLRPKELQEVLLGKDFCAWETLKQVESKQELLVFPCSLQLQPINHVFIRLIWINKLF